MDHPSNSMNVVDDELLEELRQHCADIAIDDSVMGVVLASAKDDSFGAGADVSWLDVLAERPDIEDYLRRVHQLMLQIVKSPCPFVAAINGIAFGGALELALAAESIVAVPDAQIGLPESSLGLIPGGGGTQLIRRWLGTDDSLELMLSAKPMNAREAQARGLVTEIANHDTLLDVAIAKARSLALVRERRGWNIDATDAGMGAIERRRENTSDRSGRIYHSILDVVEVGILEGPEAGFAAERRAFLEALSSTESKAIRHLFLAQRDIKRRARLGDSKVATLGVIGAGQMGSGIMAVGVARGLELRLRDVDEEKLDLARTSLSKVLQHRFEDHAVIEERLLHVSTTIGWEGFEAADAVIEAVFELPELKRDVLRAVCSNVSSDALIGTNTSAIPIHTLATSVANPERFIGTHFFSPVDRMDFVELVPHAGTSTESVVRAATLASQLGKTSIVVADKPGFFTSRVYARWLLEGVRLLLEGFSITTIDAAALSVGFPIGPMQAYDEATLDLVMMASITQVAEPVMSKRIDVNLLRDTLSQLMSAGVLGRRFGCGFYDYREGRRIGVNSNVSTVLNVSPSKGSAAQVEERLLLSFATECFLCWDDGTLCHPSDGDVAGVLAIGFPRRLGGPFRWADDLGASSIVSMCHDCGIDAFAPGATVTEFVHSGRRFAELPRRVSLYPLDAKKR